MQWLQDYTFPRESGMKDMEAAASLYQVCSHAHQNPMCQRGLHTRCLAGRARANMCIHQKPGRDLRLLHLHVLSISKNAVSLCLLCCDQSLVARLLRNGTTTALYFASLHLAPSLTLARVCAHAGQRAFIGKARAPQRPSGQHCATSGIVLAAE